MTVRRGYEFNYQLQSMQLEAHAGKFPPEHSFITVSNANVVLTAVKKSEDTDALIFRFYEWAGESGRRADYRAERRDFGNFDKPMEKPEGPALSITNGQVSVPVHPFEIVSVRVDYPR